MRYRWWERMADIAERPPASLSRTEMALAHARRFVTAWGEEAERAGWHPAHLLRPATGLAWRLQPDASFMGFSGSACVVLTSLWWAYEPHPDGSISLVTGERRRLAAMDVCAPTPRPMRLPASDRR